MGTATTEREPSDNQLPTPLELPPQTPGTAAEAPNPPILDLAFDDHLLTITIEGTPNYEYALTIDGPGDEDYTETGRLNGPQTRIDISNPTQGDWTVAGTLTSHDGLTSAPAEGSTLTTPAPAAGKPTSAELAQDSTLQAQINTEADRGESGLGPLPVVVGIVLLAALVAAALLRARSSRTSHTAHG